MTTDQIRIGNRNIQVSRTEKVLFPDDGLTKGDLIEYYESIGTAMAKYLKGRPLALERYPDGIGSGRIFHQHAPKHFPDWIDTVSVKTADGGGQVEHVTAGNTATLVYLANQACITPHAWQARADRPERPDQLIFDLDPPSGEFAAARRAAVQLHELLEDLGLPALVKTTGSKGLHLHVALDRTADFDQVRDFARDVARVLVAREPERYTIEQRKNVRGGRLYLDVMRNGYGQAAVPPYAVRALPQAPVATPLDWSEVEDSRLTADRFTLRTVPARLEADGDPWQRSRHRGRSLTRARRRLIPLLKEALA